MLRTLPEVPTRIPRMFVLGTSIVTALLAATINSDTLWTDEAFSAYIASHRSLASCWSTLAAGDSSDLQMALYYLYLHVWSQLFGQSEFAFRTANLPFILLYSAVLVWASQRLFHSRWVWIIAALTPLAITFSGDTRPYFDVIALSLTCVTCLLIYLQSPSTRERKVMPWLILLSLCIGAGFHMLMLLVMPPLLVLTSVFYFRDRHSLRWLDWKWPLITFLPIGLGMLAFFAWTFGRGASYNYARPDLMSMLSVLFRFAGLSGYSPNRRYDISFRPFLAAMALSTAVFSAGLIALLLGKRSSTNKLCVNALACALAIGVIEISVLSFAVHQQIEFRHLSSLLPLLILLIMAGISAQFGSIASRRYAVFGAVAIGITWLIGDIRSLSPDYGREDFRSAIRKSIELQNSTNAAVAIATDPIAAAYYGLAVQGPAPCFPLVDSCSQGFAKVPWPKRIPADYALFWSREKIASWLQRQRRDNRAAVLLISRGRHPTIKDSAWWPMVESRADFRIYPVRGFYLYLLP